MRKLFCLFINEMQKIGKKVAVFVLVIIMTVGMVGCSSFLKVLDHFENNYGYDSIEESIMLEESFKAQLEEYESISDEYLGEEIDKNLFYLKFEWHRNYLFGSYSKENNIVESSFKYGLLKEMQRSYEIMLNEELLGNKDGNFSEIYLAEKDKYDFYDSIIKTGDYKKYIEYENANIEASGMDAHNKALQIAYNNALYEICPSGEFESEQEMSAISNYVYEKLRLEDAIKRNIDADTGANLTEERKKDLELELEVINLKLENKAYYSVADDNNGTAFSLSVGIGTLFMVIILIILAGAMMSSETSTGTIKSLIIAPVKRWKIYIAKYLALFVMMIFLSLYTFAVSVISNGLLFGFSSYGTEIYMVFNKAVALSYFEVQFFYVLCYMVSLMVFMTLAYMMSVVTKNTAASVSVAMGAYLGGSLIHTLLMGFLSNREYITKFLPFNNTDWFNMIFKGTTGDMLSISALMSGNLFASPTSIGFAAVYIIVLLICMNWIALEAFCKKDIK